MSIPTIDSFESTQSLTHSTFPHIHYRYFSISFFFHFPSVSLMSLLFHTNTHSSCCGCCLLAACRRPRRPWFVCCSWVGWALCCCLCGGLVGWLAGCCLCWIGVRGDTAVVSAVWCRPNFGLINQSSLSGRKRRAVGWRAATIEK